MRHCPHLLLCTMQQPHAAAAPAVLQSINISYTPDPQQQTHHMLLQRANVTDGRTDGHCTITQTLLRSAKSSHDTVNSRDLFSVIFCRFAGLRLLGSWCRFLLSHSLACLLGLNIINKGHNVRSAVTDHSADKASFTGLTSGQLSPRRGQ